jgi:A/G-specific adenine glycosylase
MDFTRKLIEWYQLNKRQLPWRQSSDPYRIWVSEVILQQTRVDQGLSYYNNFLKKFPDIQALADAGEDEVLKSWQGLGYYSRARNMHAAAQQLVKDHAGRFPENYNDILSLKGIGEYSASAIASIAFNQKYPVIDGNVLRFVSRYFGIDIPVQSGKGRKIVSAKLDELISSREPGTFNEAMMEFGAMVCKPQAPLCSECIFMENCIAFRDGKVKDLPVKLYRAPVEKRFFNYLVILQKENKSSFIFINKRRNKDIWKNLYDFPLLETNEEIDLKELQKTPVWSQIFKGAKPQLLFQSHPYLHKLSHRELHINFFVFKMNNFNSDNYSRIRLDELSSYPIPRLIELFLEEYYEKISSE